LWFFPRDSVGGEKTSPPPGPGMGNGSRMQGHLYFMAGHLFLGLLEE